MFNNKAGHANGRKKKKTQNQRPGYHCTSARVLMLLQHSGGISYRDSTDARREQAKAACIANCQTTGMRCYHHVYYVRHFPFVRNMTPKARGVSIIDINSTTRRSARECAFRVPIYKTKRALYSSLQAKWGEEYGNTTLFSGGMAFSDGGRAVENKMLNAIVEQGSFRVAFTGMHIDNVCVRPVM